MKQHLVFIGTYTRTTSEGIYVHTFDSGTGALETVSVTNGIENPSFLALHPNGAVLFATSEIADFGGGNQGGVYAYSIDDESGELTLINSQGSGGPGPCHLTVDANGRYVLTANYAGGSVSVLPIEADGSLAPLSDFVQHEGSSVNPQRQGESHAHSINLDPQNHFVYVPDLGLDRVVIYRLDHERGKLLPNEPRHAEVSAGFGPRHFTFHPSGRHAYVINELGNSVTVFGYDAGSGSLRETQTIGTLPLGFSGENTTADIHVHPSGRLVYGSNRRHDSIAIFAVDQETGMLSAVGHQPTLGRIPRNFAIDPSGKFLLAGNQDSDTIVSFTIDLDSGMLTPTGHTASVPMPVCIKFLPT